jgi:LysR family hydrogen peroxide-inducible transcriptional activator
MLVQMVDSDIGVTILPQMAIDAGILNNTAIDYVPLPINRFYRDIGFAWRRGHSRRPLLTEIIQRIAASGTSGSVAD